MPSIQDRIQRQKSVISRLQRQQSKPPRTALGIVWMLQAVAENRGTEMSQEQELDILRAFKHRGQR